MYARVTTGALHGLGVEPVFVEADVFSGLPALVIVGLPDQSVKEAKDRIRSALLNSGCTYPAKRITINLAPAHIRKEGTHYDLPIAVAIAVSLGEIPYIGLQEFAFLGELSLDGRVNPVRGVLPMLIGLSGKGIRRIVLPQKNAKEAAALKDLEIYPVETLGEVINCLSTGVLPTPYEKEDIGQGLEEKKLEKDLDFADVAGQESAKRAILIAAAGFHNLLLSGPPGSGKTMLARRISTVLPPLSPGEQLDVTKIHSIAGFLTQEGELLKERPFYAPHHSATEVSLIGGGTKIRPGQITLAHRGVLFLDELTEFRQSVLETLRQPLEDGVVTIARSRETVTFPSRFMLVAAMNPCRCGYFGDDGRSCTCSQAQLQSYMRKLSGPLLDRIDLQINVQAMDHDKLCSEPQSAQSSAAMQEKVVLAVRRQGHRYKNCDIMYNSELTPLLIKRFCGLDEEGRDLLKSAFRQFQLGGRTYHKILKVSRTISDLEDQADIRPEHVAEAIRYCCMERLLQVYDNR